MNIQNNNSPQFKATRLISSQRYFNTGRNVSEETLEVFKLDKVKDSSFALKCQEILSKKLTRNLKPLQKQLKFFFESFFRDIKIDSNEYYLMLRNGEELAGGIVAVPVNKAVYITQAFAKWPKEYNLDNVLYGFLDDCRASYKNVAVNTNNMIDKFKNSKVISAEDVTTVQEKIKASQPYNRIISENLQEVDLEEYLGIKDFELEINPNLK